MSFDPAWLALREPADQAARAPGLLAEARDWLGADLAVDLGCGTGATPRAFGGAARWRLVDHDPALLALAAARCPGAETLALDLRDVATLPLAGARLVTASALFDLVSEAWADALATTLVTRGLGFYAALNYDGGMAWDPGLPEDAEVTTAFNAHQFGDKGFGPALGPNAGPALAAIFRHHGYVVRMAPSPWRLGPDEAALQAALVSGIAEATGATAWGQARNAACETSACMVGHWDVLAIPGAPSAQSKITSV